MLALCGFPFFFSGFWSKDAILHAAHAWTVSQIPFYLGAFGALLTAFYMTRQVYYVFAGSLRLAATEPRRPRLPHDYEDPAHHAAHHPHESPAVMTIPLVILAAFAVLLGFLGTPAWPWFQSFLDGTPHRFSFAAFSEPGHASTSCSPPRSSSSSASASAGSSTAASPSAPPTRPTPSTSSSPTSSPSSATPSTSTPSTPRPSSASTPSASAPPRLVRSLGLERRRPSSSPISSSASPGSTTSSTPASSTPAFDEGCDTVSRSGQLLALLQAGRIQSYLRIIGCALVALVIFLLWGAKA